MASISLLCLCLIFPGVCQISVSETLIPTADSLPRGLSLWRGQQVFFCEGAYPKIGFLDVPSGAVKELGLPLPNDDPVSVCVDADGFAWVVTNLTNSVRRIEPSSGEVKSWTPQVHEGFSDIKVAPNGLIWLASRARMSVGTLDVDTGLIKEFSAQGMKPLQMAVDKKRVWFTHPEDDKVGFLVPDTLKLTTFPLSSGARPTGIALDEGGHAWVALPGLNRIVEIDPDTGKTTFREVPTSASGVYGVAVGSDGCVWFTEAFANKIGRLDRVKNEVTEIPVPTQSSFPTSIAVASDGRVWFIEERGNKLGSVVGTATSTTDAGPPPLEGLSSATVWLVVAVAAVGCAGAWAYVRKRRTRRRQGPRAG